MGDGIPSACTSISKEVVLWKRKGMGVSSWGQQHGIAPELVRNAQSWLSSRGAGSANWEWACFTNSPGYSDDWLATG